jgi:hypothetical protein
VHRRRKKFNRAAQAFLELLLPGGAEKARLAG